MRTNSIVPRPLLSKSTFVRGCKCLKSLHLHKYNYNLKDEISESQQAIFNQGHEVGEYARQLFPRGFDCSVNPAYDYPASVRKTNEALHLGATTLYEAGFIFNNVYAAADIIVRKKDGWYLYEVKSSVEVKEYNLLDAAIQYYILKGLGLPVKAVHVVTINKNYVRKGAIDPEQLFTINDVTAEAQKLQDYVEEQLQVMLNVLSSRSIPDMEIGPQCSKYYGCDFQGHCWKRFEEVEYPVHTIKRLDEQKLWDLVKKGILCQTQIPITHPLSVHQRTQVWANKTKESPEPEFHELRSFLETIEQPVAFLDFETFLTAIPLFDDVRPYQQVPFQYSVHMFKNGMLLHDEFLGDGKTDPRRELVERLIDVLQDAKTILCYYMNFEKSRLEELKLLFPEYERPLQRIIDKLVDLIIPFRNKHVYHYKMNGSASLKHVLPALLPHLTYDNLQIQEGTSASRAYLDLFTEKDQEVVDSTRQALLEYCKLDTYAMVELLRYLRSLTPLKVVVNNLHQDDDVPVAI